MRPPSHPQSPENAGPLQQATHVLLAGCRRLGARVWSPVKSSRRPALRRETGAWGCRLEEEKDSLAAMVRGTEAEFLATGEGLKRLAQQLNHIQGACLSLTELTLGQMPDAAVQYGFHLLKKSEDLVRASDEQYEHVFTTFGELRARLALLAQQHAELLQVLLPLNFITISFRIEASRQPVEVQQAFFTLAETVNRTVSEVRTTMEGQFDELAASERIAHRLMEQVSTSIQRHRSEVNAMLKTSRIQLRVLGEALTGSGAMAADLSHRNKAITRHIGGIVMAQQCQDITRQRIEHIGTAMDEMRDHLHETRATAAAGDSDPRTYVLRAAQIQLHQVRSVFAELNHAADSLKSGIENLRADAGAAAEAAVNVGRTALETDVARQCQTGIGQILTIVKQAVDKTGDVLAAFAPLQARFLDCTSKASELAGDVRHSGLNAQVFAIHVPHGATLEVLAGQVRVISEEAIHHVGQMGAALNQTTDLVNNLRGRLEDFQLLGQTEQEILAHESALSREKLSDLERAIPLLISRVTDQQEAFAAAIEAVLTNVRFPVTIAAASSRSIGVFQDLVAWCGTGGVGTGDETAVNANIERLKSSYTMDSERLAHVAALQPVGPPPGEAAPAAVIVNYGDGPAMQTADLDPDHESALAQVTAGPVLEKSATSKELGDNVDLF